MFSPRKSALATALLLACGSAPAALAQEPAAAEVYQVVRAGDRDMTCDAVIAEINQTNAAMSANRMAAMEKMTSAANRNMTSTMATAAASGVVSSLASMVPGGSTIVGAAVQAKRAADMRTLTNQTTEATKDLMSEGDVQARLDHLSRLYESKQC